MNLPFYGLVPGGCLEPCDDDQCVEAEMPPIHASNEEHLVIVPYNQIAGIDKQFCHVVQNCLTCGAFAPQNCLLHR